MTTNGQVTLRVGEPDELTVGAGTDYRFTDDWVAWWGSPEVRTTDLPRSGAHGVTAGRDLYGAQSTPFVVQILADTITELGDRIDAWKAATAISTDTTVAVAANLLGRTRVRYGRFRTSEVLGRGKMTVSGAVANGGAQFVALDPRTYGDTLHSLATSRAVAGVGVELPVALPLTFPAGSTGAMTVTNAGNQAGPWSAVLAGPLDYPAISHLESGRRLSLDFTANGGVQLGAGDTLTLDSDRRSVLLNGTADRRTQLTVDSEWWSLAVGTNTFMLAAATGNGTLTVSWRDCWRS